MPQRKIDKEKPPYTPSNPSPCHSEVSLSQVPLFVVKHDGTEIKIGRAEYCPWEAKEGRKRPRCLKMIKLVYSKARWPKTLYLKDVPGICSKGPGFWRTFGFHITLNNGIWMSLRAEELGYQPPGWV